jgi:hypothetical protein
MNIQFDTASMNPSEAQALLVFLSTLYGQPSQPSLAPAPTTFHEQLKASVEQTAGPVLVEPTTEATTKRTRRTKEQIAADEAAKAAAPPTVGDQLAAAEAARKAAAETARKAEAAQPINGATKIDADQLRALLNGYIARHSMEDAIEKLRAFGCNRVTEALALESDKLSQLAATLNG